MSDIKPQPGVMDIDLYVGGASSLAGQSNVLKLSSNENPFGPPEAAKEAIIRAARDVHRYPSTDHASLRTAIAEVWGLEAGQLIIGNGSGEILKLLAEAYAGPDDEVVFTEHGFSMYPIYAKSCGATPVVVPERDRVMDVDAILGACTARTRLVYIANPSNPTGTMIGTSDIARLADGLPRGALLVLDGAYAEFVDGYDGGAAMVAERDNIFMSRTFSKVYGLGGMRVGWGYGPQAIIDVLNRIRGPFNLSSVALAAAEAAVKDAGFLQRCMSENAKWRDWLAHALSEHGVPSDTSSANFLLARFASAEEAQACDGHLREQGIIVRQVAGYNLPNCLRITIGDEAACKRVAHAVGQFKATTGEVRHAAL